MFVSRGYPTGKYPLLGVFEYDQACALVRAGHQIIYAVVDLRSLRRWRKWGFKSLRRDGINIEAINIPCGRLPRLILNFCGVTAFKLLYKRIVKKYGIPDVVHSHFVSPGYYSSCILKDSNVPLVHTEHSYDMHAETLSTKWYNLGKKVYPNVDIVIAVSKSLADNIEKHFGTKSLVIHNIVDTSLFRYVEKKRDRISNKFKFISVGHLQPLKKMDLLIRSFYGAFKNDPTVELYIYGEGGERINLEKIIEEHCLTNRVHLMGYASRDVIAAKMAECDSFVLASESETFGVVYVEAMAAGLPVIATKSGGPEDFIDDTNGIIVSVNDESALIEALQEMRFSRERYNSNVISSNARDRFSSTNIAKQISDVYCSLF